MEVHVGDVSFRIAAQFPPSGGLEFVHVESRTEPSRTRHFLAYLSRSGMAWRLYLTWERDFVQDARMPAKGEDYVGNTTLHPALQAHLFAHAEAAPLKTDADLTLMMRAVGLIDRLTEAEQASLIGRGRWVHDDVLSALSESCCCGEFLTQSGAAACGASAQAPFTEALATVSSTQEVFRAVGDVLRGHFELCDVDPLVDKTPYVAGKFYAMSPASGGGRGMRDVEQTFSVVRTVTVWFAAKGGGKGKAKGKGNGKGGQGARQGRVYALYVRLVRSDPAATHRWVPLCLGAVSAPGDVPEATAFGVTAKVAPCGPLVCKPFEYWVQASRFEEEAQTWTLLVGANDYAALRGRFQELVDAKEKRFPKKLPPSILSTLLRNTHVQETMLGDYPAENYFYVDMAEHYQDMWPLPALPRAAPALAGGTNGLPAFTRTGKGKSRSKSRSKSKSRRAP